jgi:hypothetical protein
LSAPQDRPVSLAKGITWLIFGGYGSEENERCTLQIYRGQNDFVNLTIHSVADLPSSLTDTFPAFDNSPDYLERMGIPFWKFFSSETKIETLSPRVRRHTQLGAAFSAPQPATEGGQWTHKGSRVSVVVSGSKWTITYAGPSELARQSGAKDGTVLFKGTQSGHSIVGTMLAYQRGCKALSFGVRGSMNNNRKFVLRGKPAIHGAACEQRTGSDVDFVYQFEADRTMQ